MRGFAARVGDRDGRPVRAMVMVTEGRSAQATVREGSALRVREPYSL